MSNSNDAKNHWIGMPEFEQDSQKPHAMLNIRFRNEEDLQEFATLIGQKLNQKSKSIWYPKLENDGTGILRWF